MKYDLLPFLNNKELEYLKAKGAGTWNTVTRHSRSPTGHRWELCFHLLSSSWPSLFGRNSFLPLSKNGWNECRSWCRVVWAGPCYQQWKGKVGSGRGADVWGLPCLGTTEIFLSVLLNVEVSPAIVVSPGCQCKRTLLLPWLTVPSASVCWCWGVCMQPHGFLGQ